MNKWIIPCNIKKYNVDGAFSKLDELEWSQGRNKVEVGDLVFIYVGMPVQCIKYKCEIIEKDIPVENCSLNDGEFSLIGRPHITDSLLYMKIRLVDKYPEGVITLEEMQKRGVKGRIQSARRVPKDLETYIDWIDDSEADGDLLPEEVKEEPGEQIIEGAKKTIIVNSYERDPKAKKICKEHYMKLHGHISCQVCGFNFGKEYGPEYANKIHVHHIIPVSEIGEDYVIDPITDLIPVCPNCHMVLHTGEGISVEELKKKVKKQKLK